MEIQKLYSKVRQAADAYRMIEEGDRIAIGISGGKDSLTLLYALAGMRNFYPKNYDVVAITVDTGVGQYMNRSKVEGPEIMSDEDRNRQTRNMDFSKVKELCDSLGVPYIIVPTRRYSRF